MSARIVVAMAAQLLCAGAGAEPQKSNEAVLFGEGHDNARDHVVQVRLLDAVLRAADSMAASQGSDRLHLSLGALVDRQRVVVSDRGFVDRVRNAQFVILGAGHDGSCEIAAQARLLDALARAGMHPVLGLEMVGGDQQGILDLFNSGGIHAERLGEALAWQQGLGEGFQQCLPVLERAEAWHIPVVGLNAPPFLSLVVEEGRPVQETPRPRPFPSPEAPPMPRGDVPKLEGGLGSDEQQVPPYPAVEPQSQSPDDLRLLRTSQIAFAAQQAARRHGGPVVILSGSGPLESGSLLGARLRQAGATTVTVQPWRGEPAADPESADLFCYCPAK